MHPELTHVIALAAEGHSTEALALIEGRARAGDGEALFLLADMHWHGQIVATDLIRGRILFGQASDAGHPIARRAYTNLLASGATGGRDWQAAIARLREEAQGDARRAQMLALIEAMPLTDMGFVATPPRGETISERPEIMLFRGLFTPQECDYLIAVAEPTYVQSKVVATDGSDIADAVRTSEDAPMHLLIEDPAIHALNRRLAAASGTRYEQGEPLLILRYRPGQQYKKHLDWLPGAANQRFKTALVYLNEEYEGGETAFTRVDRKVRGRKGDCIVFRNTGEASRADPLSEHAGLPVMSGTKYLASRWIRERPHTPDRA